MLLRSFTKLTAFGFVMAFSQIVTPNAVSQDIRNLSFDEFRNRTKSDYVEFKDSVKRDYAAFRDSVNRAYAAFMRNPWTPVDAHPQIELPAEKDHGPYIVPEDKTVQPVTNSQFFNLQSVVTPMWPLPQPTPFGEIEEQPTENEREEFMRFYGTPVFLRDTNLSEFRLNGNNELAYAEAWEKLSGPETNNFINDCLGVRDSLALPDLGYIKFLADISAKLVGADTNEQAILMGFLLNQSGYKIRFGYDTRKKLHLLFAARGRVYNKGRYPLDNTHYIPYATPAPGPMAICNFKVPGEQEVDLCINKSPKFAYSPCKTREVDVNNYPGLKLKLTPNKNLIDFYNDYPSVAPDASDYSRWVVNGNTPVSPEIKNELYPTLRKIVEGKNEYEALQILLKLAQSFPYALDDEVWGRDRTFWMEESWAYPFSDCEDHAVNFSHMVRDILGLDVCLVFYPGHLSTCVAVTDDSNPGQYVIYNDRKYMMCDPTYLYGDAGTVHESLDNSRALLIPLRKLD